MTHNKPKSIDEIRDRLIAHESSESRIKLAKVTLAKLKNRLASAANTAVSTMTDIASTNHISPSTLTRMTYGPGFNKSSHLHKLFRTPAEDAPQFYSLAAFYSYGLEMIRGRCTWNKSLIDVYE